MNNFISELLLILKKGNKIIAVECKASTAPKLSKGFWNALADIQPYKTYIIVPIAQKYPIKESVFVCGINEFLKENLFQL